MTSHEANVAGLDRWEDGERALLDLLWHLVGGLEGELGPMVGARPTRIELHLRRPGEEPVLHGVIPFDPCAGNRKCVVERLVRARLKALPVPFDGLLHLAAHHGQRGYGTELPVRVGLSRAPAMMLSHWRQLATVWRREATRSSRLMGDMFADSAYVIHASASAIQAAQRPTFPPGKADRPNVNEVLRALLDPQVVMAVAEHFRSQRTPQPEPASPYEEAPRPSVPAPPDDAWGYTEPWVPLEERYDFWASDEFEDPDPHCDGPTVDPGAPGPSSLIEDHIFGSPPWLRHSRDRQH